MLGIGSGLPNRFDAAPYFQNFNPIRQSEKFDKEGIYIRKWVPELASLSSKQIHSPWEINKKSPELTSVSLGEDYPFPIVANIPSHVSDV